uniref:solute carrier family 25 member 48 isoform X2 n=1 Tax=Myxine glutinosa TaxID=7769 RepID=UPI00358F99A5
MENFQPDDFLAGWVGGTEKTAEPITTKFWGLLVCWLATHWTRLRHDYRLGLATTPCCTASRLFIARKSALSGVAAVAVGSPIELVKIRLQMQVQAPGRQGTFRGPLHCFLTTLQQGGLLGVYRGGGAMLLRDIPGYCTYFVPYMLLCQNLTPQGKQGPHPAIIWLSGGVSGAISWGLSTPLDVVKSRLQADGVGKTKFHGIRHCIYQSYHTEGLRVFFRGTIVNCVRGFPMSAAMFLGYELSLKAIRAAQACAEL